MKQVDPEHAHTEQDVKDWYEYACRQIEMNTQVCQILRRFDQSEIDDVEALTSISEVMRGS